MRAELPWNVAGILPEAREAARAAARREGVSVGEWLTRRILRDLSDLAQLGDDDEALRKRHDTEEMLARFADAEAEASESYRRIEERLRLVGTGFDTAERSQAESNRAMSRAASEMHTAGREQAEAFDQLGRHLAGVTERLDRLERVSEQEGLKEAVKGLHQGLTRLASELGQATGRSGVQIASLARNLEQLALRLVAAREDAEKAAKLLEGRLSLVEETSHRTADALDRAVEKIEDETQTRNRLLEQLEDRTASGQTVLAGIEARLGQLEEQSRDPSLNQRLDETDRALSQVIAGLEAGDRGMGETLDRLTSRLDAVEKGHREILGAFQAHLAEARDAAAASGIAPAQDTAAAESHLSNPSPDAETPSGEGPDHAPVAAAEPPEADQPADPGESFGDAFATHFEMREDLAEALARPAPVREEAAAPDQAAAPDEESLLRAARLSSMAAPEPEERGFFRRPPGKPEGRDLRFPALLAAAFLLVLTGASLLVINDRNSPGFKPPPPSKHRVAYPAPASVAAVTTARQASSPLAPSVAATPGAAVQPADGPAAAAAGDETAETVLGLKDLDGGDPQAAAIWLGKAAAAGQPVAQYRLGTLYERGQGVPANADLAVKWYLAAAQQGNRKAMHNLAVAYAEGSAGPRNMTEAARWFAKAAALGLSDSQFNLAVLYERGQGVPQSLTDAYKWYAIAAGEGDAESKARLAVLQTQLSASEREAAEQAARDFHPLPLDAHANQAP